MLTTGAILPDLYDCPTAIHWTFCTLAERFARGPDRTIPTNEVHRYGPLTLGLDATLSQDVETTDVRRLCTDRASVDAAVLPEPGVLDTCPGSWETFHEQGRVEASRLERV
jgi:hypothetical protein